MAERDVPPQFEVILADYLRHLRAQRDLAEHTVRAYRDRSDQSVLPSL